MVAVTAQERLGMSRVTFIILAKWEKGQAMQEIT